MNVFRAVGQSLINFARGSADALSPIAPKPIPQQPVEAMPGLFQDTFEPAAAAQPSAPEPRTSHSYFSHSPAASLQTDAFEPAARAPVNLNGGVTPTFAQVEDEPAPQKVSTPDFTASLDDLEGLLG